MATGVEKRIASRVHGGQLVVGLFLALVVLAAVSVLAIGAITPGRAVESPDASTRAMDTYAARYTALAEHYAAQTEARQRAIEADAARYSGLAERFAEPSGVSQRAMDAYAARLTGLAAYYNNSRAMDAYAARLTGEAEYYLSNQ